MSIVGKYRTDFRSAVSAFRKELGIAALRAGIMNLAEMPEVMFGRNIEPLSFSISR